MNIIQKLKQIQLKMIMQYYICCFKRVEKYCSKLCLCERSIASKFSSCKIKIYFFFYWKRKLQIDDTVILDNRWIILQGSGKPPDVVVLIYNYFW